MSAVETFPLSKINLHLRVGSPRADGFHPLRSWMVTTDLHDSIQFRPFSGAGVFIECENPSVPRDQTNLIARAASALLERIAPAERFGLHVRLSKDIPAGAGLGGGSSNAASTLRVVNQLLGDRFAESDLLAIAATLGSDVPFFLGSASAIATGRGEVLEPVPVPAARVAMLILPPFGISTAQAYRMLDQIRPSADERTTDAFDAPHWATLPARQLLEKLANDLEIAAFTIEPRLGQLRSALERNLGRPVRMSGSGSTLFTLYDTAEEMPSLDPLRSTFRVEARQAQLGVRRVDPPRG